MVGFRTVEALATRNETTVITTIGMEPPQSAFGEVIAVRIDQPNDVSPWQLLRYERRQQKLLERLIRSRGFDAVHRVTPSGLKGSLLSLASVPFILGPLLLSDPYPPSFQPIFRPPLPRQLSLRAALLRIQNGFARRVFQKYSTLNDLVERAAAIIVGSPTTFKHLPPRVHSRCRPLAYAGVEHQTFHPPQSERSNRVAQVIYVGRLVPYKGAELLLRSAARAMQSCQFELKIVGGGNPSYRKYCASLADSLALTGNVEFIDNQPRASLAELYRAADIFCMPSVETYGLAILEAMSSGCAVLVSDINGPGDIVQPGTGVKVPLESPEQFISDYAERLVQLVGDAALRAKLGETARQHVVQTHDWKHIQSRLLEIYEETFAGRMSIVSVSQHAVATI